MLAAMDAPFQLLPLLKIWPPLAKMVAAKIPNLRLKGKIFYLTADMLRQGHENGILPVSQVGRDYITEW